MMAEIVIVGELLAEFVALERGQGFDAPGLFAGPFPSGAPAIFADQAARLGARVAYAGCVGRDAFGDAIVARLERDGVDITRIRRVERPTGTAFVAYRDDGSRSFVFNLATSAAACIDAGDVDAAMFDGCRYFHVMGSSLTSEAAIAAVQRGVIEAARAGAKVSFDPNVRPEMLSFRRCARRSTRCSPPAICSCRATPICRSSAGRSRPSARSPGCSPRIRCSSASCSSAARPAAPHSTGRAASTRPRGPSTNSIRPAPATASAARWSRGLVAGMPTDAALRRANAAGAIAVARRGPMEGNSDAAEIERFLTERGVACPA
jgi:fructokinase